jgi:hypothetical protein
MSSKLSKNGAYEILVAQKDAITKIMGIITPKSINTLENELGGAFTILKSTHFAEGEQYHGYLACIIPEEKYRIDIAGPMWVYVAPINPGAYAATALAAGVSAAHQEQITGQHKETQTAYTEYLGAQETGKELLLYGVGNNALAPLKKQYINFGITTIHSMILHLREKMAIKMTASQKFEYKAEGYGKQWDPTTSITAYFTGLDKFRTSLADRGIVTSIEEMAKAAGARMWESEMFTEDQMVAWENKTPAQQTWQNLQDYFTEKWLERSQYLQATAKQSRFKDAALAAQELAAAEEEGETTAMMFALLQEQDTAQLEAMAAANKQAMDVMLERMNTLIAGQGKAADKPMATVPNSNTGKASNTNRGKKYAQTAESSFSTNLKLAMS